jgi:hypothetical protein
MIRFKAPIVLLSLLAALAVACGGDKPNPVASLAGGSANSVDLSQSSAKLMALESFRFDVSIKMDLGDLLSGAGSTEDEFGAAFAELLLGLFGEIKAEGAFIAPDKIDVKMTMAGEEMAFIQIGDKAWMKEGGVWQVTEAEDFDSVLSATPADLFDLLPDQILNGAKTSSERVNGVQATRYSFDRKALEDIAKSFGEDADFKDVTEANIDVWLTQEQIPVKVSVNMGGKDDSGQSMSIRMELNVRDINSGSIQIRPPI